MTYLTAGLSSKFFKSPESRITKDPSQIGYVSPCLSVLDRGELNSHPKISPLLAVRKNIYGGRGCFQNQIVSRGTTILTTGIPVGSSVIRPFRKEVCTWCFAYHDGKTLKYRIEGKIYFYSSACLVVFSKYDPFPILRNTLIEDLYLKCEGEIQDKEVPFTKNLADVIQKRWDEVSA